MDTAERLGYEVRVYARVPDLGDGMDRRGPHPRSAGLPPSHNTIAEGSFGSFGDFNSPTKTGRWKNNRGHVRRVSGSTSTESEQGSSGAGTVGFSQAFARSIAPHGGLPSTPGGMNGGGIPTTPPSARIRYREQGVDELLQLKLHQALAAIDGPPPLNATIVLATGDGNVGQFNDDGFLGPVRTALKKGWRVELYAWEEGLSRAWMREFGEWSGEDGRFRVVGMEQFAEELVEIY